MPVEVLDRVRRWLRAPAGDYLRCYGCGRLRKDQWFGNRMARKLPICPCDRSMGRVREPHPNSIRWHERLRIFLGII